MNWLCFILTADCKANQKHGIIHKLMRLAASAAGSAHFTLPSKHQGPSSHCPSLFPEQKICESRHTQERWRHPLLHTAAAAAPDTIHTAEPAARRANRPRRSQARGKATRQLAEGHPPPCPPGARRTGAHQRGTG